MQNGNIHWTYKRVQDPTWKTWEYIVSMTFADGYVIQTRFSIRK